MAKTLRRSREGFLLKKSEGILRDWKQYEFKLSQTYFHYFQAGKLKGQLLSCQLTRVEIPVTKRESSEKFPFEVHFSSKGSPWILGATSEEERIAWMEALIPGSTARFSTIVEKGGIVLPISPSVSELLPQQGHTQLVSVQSQPISLHSQLSSPHSRPVSPHTLSISPNPHPVPLKSPPVSPNHHPLLLKSPTVSPNHHPLPLKSPPVSPNPHPLPLKSPTVSPNHHTGSCVSTSGRGQQVQPPETRQLHNVASTSSSFSTADKRSTSMPNAIDSEYYCVGPSSPEKHVYFELVAQSETYLEPMASIGMRSPDVVPSASSKGSQDSVPPCGSNICSVDSSIVHAADNLPTDQTQIVIDMMSRLNPDVKHAERRSTSPAQLPHLVTMLADSPKLDSLLSTEEDNVQPQWTRARTTTVSSLDGVQLLTLQKEALFIPPSSLSDHIPIGKGQFGEVFRATLHKGTPGEVLVAVKTTKKDSSEKEREDFMKEMAVMSQILHPNIVRLYGLVVENAKSLSIILEYLPKGDLKHFLTANPRPTKQLVKYMIDVAMGMHYISEKGLVHRDLAARNVLVGENEVCKVADFGLLRELAVENSIYQSTANAPLPVRWMAPESIRDRTFSAASDVWSYGILMWEMFNPDKKPYPTLSNMECTIAVFQGTRLPIPSSAPSIVARLMKSCWHKQPEKRPNFLVISSMLIAKGLVEAEQK